MSNEKDYQSYIDNLHAEIAELKKQLDAALGIVTEQGNQLDAYETAMINAFVKWGASK